MKKLFVKGVLFWATVLQVMSFISTLDFLTIDIQGFIAFLYYAATTVLLIIACKRVLSYNDIRKISGYNILEKWLNKYLQEK